VAAGRQGDRAGAEQAYAKGEEALTPVPWWHRFLRLFTLECAVADGWGDPVPQLQADLTTFEASGNESWLGSAVICYAAPARPPGGAVATRPCRRRSAPWESPVGNWTY
jgi:hypothetical protein